MSSQARRERMDWVGVSQGEEGHPKGLVDPHREEGLLEHQQGPGEADHQQWLGAQQAEENALERRGHDQLRHPDQVLCLLSWGGRNRLRGLAAGPCVLPTAPPQSLSLPSSPPKVMAGDRAAK